MMRNSQPGTPHTIRTDVDGRLLRLYRTIERHPIHGEATLPELEKLTINLNPVDLGQIELLVEQGFYSNRAEFIRVAIHNQLARHSDNVRDAASRHSMVIGAVLYDRAGLEKRRQSGEPLNVHVIGYLSLAEDVTPELARETIESVRVRGIFRATRAVKEALADRTS